MNACKVCLESVRGESAYHDRCLRALFGKGKVPTLDIEVSKLHTAALAMVGHTSLSGIQKKISVNLSADRETLTVAAEGGLYILKPQAGTYPALPENEHVTTLIAKGTGIDVGDAGLLTLKDDTLAYIVRRFDRTLDGKKVLQEDFCQLAEKPPKEKYEGSAELCVRLLQKYASEPLIEIRKLFKLLIFVWWSGNGDMHLKNFSLLADKEGITRLTPAYDLLCTQLVIDDDPLAMPVNGKKSRLRRGDWKRLADYCTLPEKVAEQIIQEQVNALDDANKLISQSFLPGDQKQHYEEILTENSEALLNS